MARKANAAIIGAIIIGAVLLIGVYSLNLHSGFTGFLVLGDNSNTFCGASVNESSTLEGNITGCSENGLNINASNIILDCQGYSIIGTGVGMGINITNLTNITIINCTLINFTYGILANISNAVNLTGNTAYNNSYGFFIESSNSTMQKNVLYANLKDFFASNLFSSSSKLEIINMSFLNPSGTKENYTSLNITDEVDEAYQYSISWATNYSELPENRISVANKYINITDEAGYGSGIDSASWILPASELSGYNTSKLELWNYDGSNWNLVDSSLPFTEWVLEPGIYAVLQDNYTKICGKYVSSSDVLTSNLSFERNGVCVNTSNITFDCQGYSIIGNGTGAGIDIFNLTNVTIINCTLINFTYGILANISNAVNLTGNTAYNNSYGFFIEGSGSVLLNNILYDNSKDLVVSNLFNKQFNLNMTNTSFLNPSGTFENYTLLSIYDYVSVFDYSQYSISWSTNLSNSPNKKFSIANKYINITDEEGYGIDIDTATWTLPISELSGYNLSLAEIWGWNGADWYLASSDISNDSSNFYLTGSGLGDGIYGVFQDNSTLFCGAGVDSDNFLARDMTCNETGLFINSSNVTLDCRGFKISLSGNNSVGFNITSQNMLLSRTVV